MPALLADPVLGLLAETVDDLESARKAAENRLRSLTDPEVYGLTDLNPAVQQARSVAAGISDSETNAIKALEKRMRQHPLGVWAKTATGVGDKQLARLLAVIGDPFWHNGHYQDANGDYYPYDRPRRITELRAYCGLDVRDGRAPRHRKGQQGNWNDSARMRVWNIAQSCIKSKGYYRDVYDDGRAKYADALHTTECERCGPSGKPAQPGTPLSDGHKHARATRLIMREILRDLWETARDYHNDTGMETAA